jgi:hypothetical protein
MGVIDDILAKEPEQRTVEFCTDRALREQLATAQYELETAKHRADRVRGDKERADELAREIDDLEEQIEGLTAEVRETGLIRFTFAALEPEEFDDLKGQHRPTERQLTKARKEKQPQPDWNEDTFSPVLVAAACIKIESPSGSVDGLSVEDAERIWHSRAYNSAERAELFNTALAAQLTRTRVDLPKGA